MNKDREVTRLDFVEEYSGTHCVQDPTCNVVSSTLRKGHQITLRIASNKVRTQRKFIPSVSGATAPSFHASASMCSVAQPGLLQTRPGLRGRTLASMCVDPWSEHGRRPISRGAVYRQHGLWTSPCPACLIEER